MELTKEKLQQILDDHQHWIKQDVKNWRHMRADLSGMNLHKANLRNANLSGALLYKTNLSEAKLVGANLKNAELSRANLSDADLYGADISSATLDGANLYKAYLQRANLSLSYLYEANLEKAYLYGASLYEATLCLADLSGAYLTGANLYGADLRMAKNVPFIPSVCPETGSFIGYKKANGFIIELEILSDAKRSSATTRKCRCSKAKVLSIQFANGIKADIAQVRSNWDPGFIYTVGETVEVKKLRRRPMV